MAVALIVAAGRGERLGLGRPKALVALAGKPMVEWSLAALRGVPTVERTVIALPSGTDFAPAQADRVVCVAGGTARSQSVQAALNAAGEGDPVIVHDAARPLASSALFERALAALERSGADAVIAAAPVSDTIKEVSADGRTVSRTLDRAKLWAVQTPQVFRRQALERALGEATDELLARATDDAWLLERLGLTVRVIESERTNIKVTTAVDLRVAEALLKA
ncbi:MAG: 2-C-methyl-D-erythritol 4-phosphate cytidylyltransferase [Actinobacteria bacterium]|nr:MAG: 2-C-methyl-D-erythritol 4-phosphate cytidylyltransferase [Actinomycetota bacterium]